jgi:hypothetical protein
MNCLNGSFLSLEVVKNMEIQNKSNPSRKDALAALI